MKKTIIDIAARDAAIEAIRAAAAKPAGTTKTGVLVVRNPAAISADSGKNRGCVGLAVKGGRYEIHASARFGDIWVYDTGILAHEEDNRVLADEICDIARRS